MTIKYHVTKIPMTSGPNDYSGRVEPSGTLTESLILDEMLKRSSGLSRQEILGVLDLYAEVLSDKVQDGFTVLTRLANFRAGIKGVFNGVADPFDPARHFFRASITEGVLLKKKMRKAVGERQTAPAASRPVLNDYYDHSASRSNKTMTPGSIGTITGENLKYNPENLEEGIYLISKTDEAETRVKIVSLITDKKLMFLIPAELVSGLYRIEVRRVYTGKNEIRAGSLLKSIHVPER